MILISKFVSFLHTLKYSILLSKKLSELRVYGSLKLVAPSKFKTGKGLRLNYGCYIHAIGGINAGNNLTVSAGAKILTSEIDISLFKKESRDCDYHTNSAVSLGDNIWLGANSIVLPGVSLSGQNVIVAAGSVVTKSFDESNVVLAGSPARIIKRI